MVMFHKLDNTQLASIGVSEGKANTALRFKRPSKALDDVIVAGGAGLRLLAVKDITPLEGGLPVILDGTIIGAIGVSGALSAQDAQVARAGAAAVVRRQARVLRDDEARRIAASIVKCLGAGAALTSASSSTSPTRFSAPTGFLTRAMNQDGQGLQRILLRIP